MSIYLRDFAPEVYDSTIKPRDLSTLKPGQMGINFIDTVMDSWEFATPKDGYGNLLIMKKEIVKTTADWLRCPFLLNSFTVNPQYI